MPLSRQQARDLAREARELADWITMRDFAAQIYGEGKAAKIRVETCEEYDDENYSYPIGFIDAHDANGERLVPDRSLPFFQTEQWQNAERRAKCNENALYRFNEDLGLVDVLKEIKITPTSRASLPWLFLDELPENSKTYDLATTPEPPSLPQEVASCH